MNPFKYIKDCIYRYRHRSAMIVNHAIPLLKLYQIPYVHQSDQLIVYDIQCIADDLRALNDLIGHPSLRLRRSDISRDTLDTTVPIITIHDPTLWTYVQIAHIWTASYRSFDIVYVIAALQQYLTTSDTPYHHTDLTDLPILSHLHVPYTTFMDTLYIRESDMSKVCQYLPDGSANCSSASSEYILTKCPIYDTVDTARVHPMLTIYGVRDDVWHHACIAIAVIDDTWLAHTRPLDYGWHLNIVKCISYLIDQLSQIATPSPTISNHH